MEAPALFLCAAFGFTAAAWGAAVAGGPQLRARSALVALGGAGPVIAALASAAWGSSSVTLPDLLHAVCTPPAVTTCLAAVALPMLLVALPLAVCARIAPHILARSLHDPRSPKPSIYPSLPGPAIFLLLMLGTPVLVLEELGWRAFLLPTLLHAGWSVHGASVFTGIAWALWHAPLFHHGGHPHDPAHALAVLHTAHIPQRMAVYTAMLVCMSYLCTWVSLPVPAAASVWPAVLVHSAMNSTFAAFRVERDVTAVFAPVLATLVPMAVALHLLMPALA
mmetsp:Transcript_53056/g.133400  ORF Transcript_53056/g.133400 Transcript_53056/m.133400 type:complete len:279 (-) Transcript_53056:154-990(-)